VKKLLNYLKKLVLWMFILHVVYILYCWVFPPPLTLTQLGSLLSGHGLSKSWTSYGNISPNAPLAVMASEDQLFPDHNGFDWKSIEKAMAYNKRKPGRVRGASTISQQVAKNVFLWQGRSWVRKGFEVYFTFVIETLYSKKRIMELYLNVAEMGEGVFGIGAASTQYFGKPASRLTAMEAAKIAASLPNPKKYTVKPLSGYVSRRSGWVLRQMNQLRGDPDVEALLPQTARK
jgi:monofunctional biosynthetic peptidoglycan transglycosylase